MKRGKNEEKVDKLKTILQEVGVEISDLKDKKNISLFK